MKFRAEIIGLWSLGVKSGTIAGLLGISRSAVMGKIHRLRAEGVELDARPQFKPKPQHRLPDLRRYNGARSRPPKPPAPEPVFVIPEPEIKSEPIGIGILEIGHAQCRWQIGRDETPYHLAIYCGAGTEVIRGAARSYCPEHCKPAYIESVRKPRRTARGP